MVLLTRSLYRLAHPSSAFTSSAFNAARTTSQSSILRSGALSPRHNTLGSIRTLTGKREKVKVLLVLYDGKDHAKQVRLHSPAN